MSLDPHELKLIVEKELKDYEMEHTLRIRLENINYELVREKQENEKKLKALDIIKKYNIRPSDLLYHTTYIAYLYNMTIITEGDEIMSEEEYDLLKEVLK